MSGVPRDRDAYPYEEVGRHMRPADPGEPWFSRFILRPVVFVAYQFSAEARFIRKHRRRR